MSVLDELRALERQVEKRLRELAPVVAEYGDLVKVAERLGLRREGQGTEEVPAVPGRAPGEDAASRGGRAAGARKARPRPKGAARRAKAEAAKPQTAAEPKAAAKSKRAAAKAAKPSAAGRASAKPKSGARRRSAAAPGQREQDVLRLVAERPGVTVAQLAAELEVEATGLYGVVRRLQGKGQISKDGTALRLASASGAAADEAVGADTAAAGVAEADGGAGADAPTSTAEQPS